MKKIFLVLIMLLASFLRLYHLDINPPSLYWDEASLGFNAYSILLTGFDEHGEKFPLDRFIAFGDYKPPGYIYAAVPSIAVFGLNEFAVRFPSSLAGIIMVFLTYLLTKKLFGKEKIALLAALLLAVSPWSLHLSRAAFEANLAALFNLSAVYFFILSRKKKGIYVIISLLFFLASFYTFNANRIIAPLLYLFLSLIYFKDQLKNYKWHILAVIVSAIILLPSVNFLLSKESKLRFQEVSIFNNLQPVLLSNQRQVQDNSSIFSKVIHNRRILFFADYLKHYTDNFNGRFLFTHGDVNPRLSVQGMGQLYFFELPYLLIGILFLINKRKDIAVFIFTWMFVSVIPAGAAKETPHALRIVSILPTYQILIALGVYQFVRWLKKYLLARHSFSVGGLFVICSLLFGNLFYYLHLYHIHFPVENAGQFQFGTKEMVKYVSSVQNNYDRIFVTSEIGRPYIFFAFYSPVNPDNFQKNKIAVKDWLGFWDISSLGKIEFNLKNINGFYGKSLLVTNTRNLPGNYRLIKIIYDLQNQPVFYIGHNI